MLETLWDVEKTCFSLHTGGTAGAIFNVLGCQFRDPILVEIRSKKVSMVILSPPLSQLKQRNSGDSILIKYGTV